MFVGDILQLQPVTHRSHFYTSLVVLHMWKDSVVYDELTINERQKSDVESGLCETWLSHG